MQWHDEAEDRVGGNLRFNLTPCARLTCPPEEVVQFRWAGRRERRTRREVRTLLRALKGENHLPQLIAGPPF